MENGIFLFSILHFALSILHCVNMRVAVISAEAVPYSKTGGLGDVAGALPKALKRVGVDSVLITPCYWQTKGEYLWNTAVEDLMVPWKGGTYHAKAFYSEANG